MSLSLGREVRLDGDWAGRYASSLHDDPLRYERLGTVHPLVAFVQAFPLLERSLAELPGDVRLQDILHSEQQIAHHQPLVPGELLRVRAKISPPYTYGLRAAATICTRVRGHLGGSATLRTVIVVPQSDGLARPRARTRVARGGPEVATGSIVVSRGMVAAYSATSGDRNPIHLDPEAARARDHPGALVPGMLTFGLVLSAATSSLGARWEYPTYLALSMQRRVVVEDALQWSARSTTDGYAVQAFNSEGTALRGVCMPARPRA